MITNKAKEVPLAQLHVYIQNETTSSPEKAAITDDAEMYLIDHIVCAHTRNKLIGKLRDLQFLVRWEGYTQESDTWQTWGALKQSPKLKIFLENHVKQSYRDLVKELPALEAEEES